jgi:hypothetical protein
VVKLSFTRLLVQQLCLSAMAFYSIHILQHDDLWVNGLHLQCFYFSSICEFWVLGFTFNVMSTNMKCKIEECARVGFELELGIDSIVLNNQFIKLSKKCFFLML